MPASVLPVWSLWRRLQSQRDFVVFNPRYARRLESLGLKNAASIVDLPGEVISGHADRHVVAVNVDRHRFILKREHCVAWRTRWRNLFAGFGWVSLSGREAKVLDELAREEVPVSRWLAYGEHKGRAFLLLRRERGRDLRWMLRRGRLPVHHRRSLARSVGQAIAAIVRAGMSAPDLSAKHILVRRNRSIVLLDWPRARRSSKSDIAACVAMLARLHASLAPELATARERVLVLKSCLQTLQMNNPLPALARRIAKLSECHARSRSIREQLQEARREPRIRWLDGERICVTNDCWDTLQGRIPDWLANAASGCPTKTRMIRLAVPAIGSAWLLQVPPSAGWRSTVARIVEWPVRSPAIAQAGLLFRLARHGVPVPQVLAFGGRDDGSGFLLAKTQDSSRSLRGWLALPRPERGHMLRRLGQVLHRCHAAGCFNIASESLVVVEDERPQLRLEFDPAWKKSSPPSEEVKAAQLQQLARDLGLTRSEDIAQLSHGYAGTATDVDTGLRVADWTHIAPADPEAVLTVNPGDLFHAKQGRSIARWCMGNGLVVYLKRHYHESRIRGWLAALTRQPSWSAAQQEYNRLKRAAAEGFAVPRAVAVGVGIGPAGRLRGYLAVEELDGMKALHELIPQAQAQLPGNRFALWKRGVIAELARVARSLHQRRYFHKDLYLCHFFAAERSVASPPKDWTGQLALIDLHRFARHTLTWRWWQLKDLAQLLYSTSVPGITARDRLRFWRIYAGPNRNRGMGWLVRRLVLVRWNNYRGHNELRRVA